MRTDGQTEEQRDTTKPAVAFRNFGKAVKNYGKGLEQFCLKHATKMDDW